MPTSDEMAVAGIPADAAQYVNTGEIKTGVSAAGSTISDATALGKDGMQVIDTVGSGAGVALNDSIPIGSSQTVVNCGDNALDVYPASGDTINGLAASAPYIVGVDAGAEFKRITASRWVTIGSHNS